MVRRRSLEKHGTKSFHLGSEPFSGSEMEGLTSAQMKAAWKCKYVLITFNNGVRVARAFYKSNQFNLVKTRYSKAISMASGESVGAVRKRLFRPKKRVKKLVKVK